LPSAESPRTGPRDPESYPLERRTFWPWRLIAAIVLPWLSWVAKVDWIHLERLPRRGPFVLAANHYSELDVLYMVELIWRIGRLPRFLAKASIWKIPVVGRIMTDSQQIKVEREGSGAGSIRAAEQIIADGSAVVVYPEGTLTREPDLWPMRGKTGAARIALEAGVPVIPVAHWGIQGIMPRYGKIKLFGRRRPVSVLVGEPVDLDQWRGKPLDQKTLTEATEAIMAAITVLLEELRGEQAPAERYDPVKHGQSEHGNLQKAAKRAKRP